MFVALNAPFTYMEKIMRISEIKNLTEDRKVKSILSFLWDTEEFSNPLKAYHNTDCTIENVYNLVKEVYLNMPDSVHNKYKREISRLSKILYGDAFYWTIGTIWEEERIKHKLMMSRNEAKVVSILPVFFELRVNVPKSVYFL